MKINGYEIEAGADLRGANLSGANLSVADLRGADLRGADLRGANLDYSCLPLWCWGQGAKVDGKLARQFILHALAFECEDPEYSRLRKEAEVFCSDSHRRDDVKW